MAGPKPRAIVLDIEGTIAPISFVTNKLFPYARQHLKSHLTTTFESEETQSDITVLKSEVCFYLVECLGELDSLRVQATFEISNLMSLAQILPLCDVKPYFVDTCAEAVSIFMR